MSSSSQESVSKPSHRTVAPARSAAMTQGRTSPSWSSRVTTTSSPGPQSRDSSRATSIVIAVIDRPNAMPRGSASPTKLAIAARAPSVISSASRSGACSEPRWHRPALMALPTASATDAGVSDPPGPSKRASPCDGPWVRAGNSRRTVATSYVLVVMRAMLTGRPWSGSVETPPIGAAVELDVHGLEALVPLGLGVRRVCAPVGLGQRDGVGEGREQGARPEPALEDDVELDPEHADHRGQEEQRHQTQHQTERRVERRRLGQHAPDVHRAADLEHVPPDGDEERARHRHAGGVWPDGPQAHQEGQHQARGEDAQEASSPPQGRGLEEADHAGVAGQHRQRGETEDREAAETHDDQAAQPEQERVGAAVARERPTRC